LIDNGRNSKVTNFLVDLDSVLWLKSRLCVRNVDELRRKILEETNHSYIIHLVSNNKMY